MLYEWKDVLEKLDEVAIKNFVLEMWSYSVLLP